MNSSTKALLLQDYLHSNFRNLGEFGLALMNTYDDIAYELVLKDARNARGHRVCGNASGPTRQSIEEIVKINGLTGDYKILEIDCQREFFCILAQIRDDLKLERETFGSRVVVKEQG